MVESDDQKNNEPMSIQALTELKMLALEWSTRLEFCEVEKNRLIEFNQRSNRMLQAETEKRSSLEAQLLKLRGECEQASKSLLEANSSLKQSENELERLKNELGAKADEFQAEIERLKQSNVNTIEEHRISMEELRNNANELKIENERLKSTLGELEKTKNEDLQKSLDDLKAENERLKLSLDECEKMKNEDLQKSLDNLKAENERLKLSLDECEKMKNEDLQKSLDNLKAENERLKFGLDECEKKKTESGINSAASSADQDETKKRAREEQDEAATFKRPKCNIDFSAELEECLQDASLQMTFDLKLIRNLRQKLTEIEVSRDGYMNLAASISDALTKSSSLELVSSTEHIRFLLSETIAARGKLKNAQLLH